MKIKPKTFTNNTSALDLFMCLILVIAGALMFLMMIQKSKKNVEAKAEILITITWDKNDPSDVDTWFQDPLGNIISFRQKQKGLMHLDRDDLGHSNDFVETDFGTFKYDENKEIVTIRGTMEGQYVLNVHMYTKNFNYSELPTEVDIKIEKLNPYKIILIRKVELAKNGDLKFVCSFIVGKDGDVIEIDDTREVFLLDFYNSN